MSGYVHTFRVKPTSKKQIAEMEKAMAEFLAKGEVIILNDCHDIKYQSLDGPAQ